MFRDFVINSGMLIAFLSICYQIFRNTGLNPQLPIGLKIKMGLIFGIMGMVLVEFSVKLTNHLIVDLRILPILIACLYGGFIPGIFASSTIAVFRIIRFGFSVTAFAASISTFILPLLTYPLFRKQKQLWKKWIYGSIIFEFIISLNYAVFIDGMKNKILIITLFCSVTSLIAFLIYYYIGYLEAYTFAFRRYQQESKKDFLTGLNNARQFDAIYNNIIEKSKTDKRQISLLFLDIDFFKKVNDTYGHEDGDIVLKTLGDLLIHNCRDIDIVSRNGGEEFSVILPDCTSDLALEIAERLRKKVENTSFILSNGVIIKITISIGISSYPDKISNINILKEKADEALYSAKRAGRNRVVQAK
ncbi:diguanylate cyclase [Ruminiclostridium cellobioparum]|uniref:diguanylate cyclase n=1 Tax=Ruminiclostridium cellobioparum TaxID=29355 RepID=UPI0028A8B364|nr:diguanylate cyclase [Ruminiclostridium cellobioparum]